MTAKFYIFVANMDSEIVQKTHISCSNLLLLKETLISNPLKGQCHEIFDHLYCLYDSTWAPWVNRQNGFANCLFLEKIFDCKVRNLTVNNYVNIVSEQSKTMRTHIFKMYIFNLNFLLLVTHILLK